MIDRRFQFDISDESANELQQILKNELGHDFSHEECILGRKVLVALVCWKVHVTVERHQRAGEPFPQLHEFPPDLVALFEMADRMN